jgi:hypothetical protein
LSKVLITLTLIIIGFLFLIIYSFLHSYSVGHNDPVAVEASKQYFENIQLSAEYRNGTDYFTIDLLDSNSIKIGAGDRFGGVIIEPQYSIAGDTISVLEDNRPINKYINSDMFLIKGNKVYYILDNHKHFDTTQYMIVKFNKLKL